VKYLTSQAVHAPGHPEALEAATDAVMAALADLEEADPRVNDVDLGGSYLTGHIDVRMLIDADNEGEAALYAFTTLRAAIHATGGLTPGWENATVQLVVTREDAAEDLYADA
jgi:hypothetical protein